MAYLQMETTMAGAFAVRLLNTLRNLLLARRILVDCIGISCVV